MSSESLSDLPAKYLQKLGKLKMAAQAVMTDDLRQLAADDRRKVRNFENQLLGHCGVYDPGGDEDGMLIVGDDIRINSPSAEKSLWPRALPWLVAAIAGGAVAYSASRTPSGVTSMSALPAETQWELRIVERPP